MGRKKWAKRLVIDVFNKTSASPITNKARCWHCNKVIIRHRRTLKDGYGAWHIDHYPVKYADIESQYCCGVTDQHDITNLVPSCIICNISHKYERKKWYYCGYSQCYCKRRCILSISILSLLIIILVLCI